MKDGNAFDTSKENLNGLKPIDIIRQRCNDKNPYDTNLHEILKVEPLLREDPVVRATEARKMQMLKKKLT